MWRDRVGDAEKMGAQLAGGALTAMRTLVDHWPSPWAQRRFMGERLGVWVLAVLWLSVVTAVAVLVVY